MIKNKITYLTARAMALVLGVACAVAPAEAKKNTVKFDDKQSSGFNALDYVLQKPLGNPSFPEGERGFARNMFVGVNLGGTWFTNHFLSNMQPGANIGVRVGGWFTPVHGLQLGIDGGFQSVHKNVKNAWYGSFHGEYMLNVTNLMDGYDANRLFEFIGTTGFMYQRIRQDNRWSNNYGLSAALQMRFNVARPLYLYVEPQITVLAGSRYNAPYSWYRVNTNLGLNVGIGYRILSGNRRAEVGSPFVQTKDDNLYFGGGIGLMGFANSDLELRNPISRAFVGKMFSSTSGLQLGLAFSQYKPKDGSHRKYINTASLDYVLNINNACGGYQPDATFQLLLNAGVSAGVVTKGGDRKIYPGLQAGLMGLFRLSHNWGLYIHPQLSSFADGLTQSMGRNGAPILSGDIGLRYTIGDFSTNHPNSYPTYNAQPGHWFFNAGIGGGMRMRVNDEKGGDIFVGVGKRFTPVSSWRVNLEGDLFKNKKTFTVHADYMSSISTAMAGYNPDRLFDLQLVVGAFGGMARANTYTKPTLGLTGGLQANFRLNNTLDLYVEPQALAVYGPTKDGSSNFWSPELKAQIGVRYKFGQTK